MPEEIINNTPKEGGDIGLGASIDAAVNPNAPSAQDLATIQQANAQFTPPPADTLTPITAVGNQGQASLMPTLNQPINVGTSSGQIIGSHGVFVDPGTVAPFGVMMEQQKQLQVAQQQQDELANQAAKQAHLAKQAKDKAFKFERPKLPSLKDPGFQKSLNETGNATINSYIDQAKQLYGKDWNVALKSDTRVGREFQQAMDGINVLARNADLMTDKFADVQAGIKDGKTYYSDGVKKSFRDYEQMLGAFEKGDVNALANARQVLKDIDGHIELNNFLKDSGILTNVVAKVTGGTGISGIQDFMKLRTSNKKSYDNNINAMIQNVRKSLGSDYPYSDSDIRNALEGHFQNTSTSKTTLTSKPKKTGRGISKEDINFSQGKKPVKVTFTNRDSEGNPVETQGSFVATTSQPIPTGEGAMNAVGLQFVNQQGDNDLQADVKNITPVEAQVIEYTKDGKTYSKRVIVATSESEEPVGVFGDKTKKITKTHLIDYDSNRDRWATELGTDFDEAFSALEVNESDSGTGKAVGKASTGRTTQSAKTISSEDDYNSLAPGDTYIYEGVEYTKE